MNFLPLVVESQQDWTRGLVRGETNQGSSGPMRNRLVDKIVFDAGGVVEGEARCHSKDSYKRSMNIA